MTAAGKIIRKKIAIVITRLDLGGAQKVALYLAQHLDPKKFEVHLIAGKGGILDKEVRSSEFGDEGKLHLGTPNSELHLNLWEEIVHPIRPIRDLRAFLKLKRYFKENAIEIVHTHSSKAGLLGRLAAASAGVKTIIHTVHGFPFHEYQNPVMHRIYVWLERFAARYTTKLVAVGKDVVGYGLKYGVGKGEQYEVIRAGVDLMEFGDKRQETKVRRRAYLKSIGLKPDVFTIGMIGNLKKQKNPDEFIGVAAETLKRSPDTQFVFAGGGEELESFRRRALDAGINGKVKFVGWTREPDVFMRSIDLFLLTSLWEGLPCTLAQAVAAGKPVVATAIGGNTELVEGARAGMLYKPGDVNGAATAVVKIKEGKVRVKPLTAFLRDFDLDHMVKRHTALYNSTAGKVLK